MNFKILGFLYFLISFFMFLLGGILILGVRIELFSNFINSFQPEFFNSLFTIHGLIMIFGFIIPCFTGFYYCVIPNFFFLNNFIFFKIGFFSLFLLFLSNIFLILSFFLPFGNFSYGWTMYTPLSLQSSYNFDFLIFSVYFISFSFIINSLNISLSILKFFNLPLIKMSIFLWTILISSYLTLIVIPIIFGLLTMVLFDKYFKTSFFNPIFLGDSIMYQHIFWFFGHPEVYIIILPSFGIASQIISVFTKKKIFSYLSIIYALISISIISLIVWGHHMFTSNISFLYSSFFMYCTMLISIPTGIKIFNWLYTIWRGFLFFETPFLFIIGFLFFFLIGGLSGLMLSSIPLDFFYHGTYFIVAHFHYIMVSSSIFSIYSFWYYWSPLIFKIKFNNNFSKIHFWSSFFFLNFSFFPMHFLGFKGMPRRYINYLSEHIFFNRFITFNSFFFGFSQLFYFYFIFFPLLWF
ncbi:Cytochrome c oxidase polypeptide I [Candidatus Nasuia deltocephalinicola]|uniref:Cytochrome c oxidase polypeptide I n=1 Tax=Candidatus Nasuia deltocephalincola TaxID=1160784 RepID=A0A0S2UPF9_9PROT|nr:Cytochrome c oxidase polypeptide I [Candidatus Nasuia deltocephalinicola]